MPRYAVTGTDDVISPSNTACQLQRAATRRSKIYDYTLSASGAPADNAIQWKVGRTETAPTGTAVVPEPLDLGDGASISIADENVTVESTYTAGGELWENAINQRATYRWVAAPGGELIIPDTALAGIGFLPTHAAYTGQVEVTLHFEE